MADRFTQFLMHPATQMAAGIMAGSDPNQEGLGGVGQGIMTAGQAVRQQQLEQQRQEVLRLQQQQQMFKMQQAQIAAEQAEQQRQARQSYLSTLDPELASQLEAFPSMAGDILNPSPMVVGKGGSIYDPRRRRFERPAGVVDPADFKTEWNVRKDIQKADATFAEVSNRASQIMQLVNTPGGFADVALVNNLAKFMDPGSVVRPGETETIQRAGGLYNELVSMLQSVAGKGTITPKVRKDIVRTMNKLMGIYRGEYNARRKDTRSFLRGRGQSPDLMGVPLNFPKFTYTLEEGSEEDDKAFVEAELEKRGL